MLVTKAFYSMVTWTNSPLLRDGMMDFILTNLNWLGIDFMLGVVQTMDIQYLDRSYQ